MRQVRHWLLALGLIALTAFAPAALAVSKTFTGPGNFSNAALWSGGTLPVAGDNLRINGACVYDVTTNLPYGYLRVGRTKAGTLTWPAGSTAVLQATYVYSSVKGSVIDMTNGGVLQINTTSALKKTPWVTTNMTFTPGTGTVVWNVNYTQSLPAAIPAYNNLTVSSAAAVTSLGAATTVAGNLSISSGTLSTGAFALNVGGNFTTAGTFTAGTGLVTMNGAAVQTVAGTNVFNNLTLSNPVEVVISGSTTVNGPTFTTGATTILTVNAGSTLTVGGIPYTGPCRGLWGPGYCAPATAANFDCIETGVTYTANPAAPARNPLYTKLAGTAFSFDVVVLKANGTVETNYAKSVTVELVDTSAAGTCSTYPALNPAPNPGVSQVLAFAAGNQGRKATAGMTVSKSYPSLACRVTDKSVTPNVVGCSADRFSVRPVSLTLTAAGLGADATGANMTATPVVKAGAAFALTATASDAGYTGTPTLDGTQLVAHAGAVRNGSVAGAFGAAVGGAATGNAFTYDDVGYFKLNANGVLDATFTAVDSAVGDCTADFSTTLAGSKYGCKVGSAPTAYFGRFIPDHFDTAVTDGCAGCGFTYSGQAFSLKVTAMNGLATPGKTSNYAKAVTLTDVNAAVPPVGVLSPSTIAATAFTAGVATIAPSYTFAVVKTAPATIRLRAGDADVNVAGVNEGTTKVRSGRIRIANAHGSELLPLPMLAAVQYYDGANWVASSTDNATAFNTNLVAAGGNVTSTVVKGPLTGVSVQNANANAVIGGVKTITLAKPGAAGSVDISLGAPNYLMAGSNGAGVNPSIAGRATFSVYKGGNFVYLREAY